MFPLLYSHSVGELTDSAVPGGGGSQAIGSACIVFARFDSRDPILNSATLRHDN